MLSASRPAGSNPGTIELLRTGLAVVLAIGLGGTEIELLLLKHTDGFWQLVPVALVGAGLVALAWYGVARNAVSLRLLQGLMAVFLISGAVGTIQHFRGNVAYERDSNPSLSGMALYRSALMGSTPSLAPGTMIQLGLIGLLFAFRHPLLADRKRREAPISSRIAP
jgi:hypothetical protein